MIPGMKQDQREKKGGQKNQTNKKIRNKEQPVIDIQTSPMDSGVLVV